MKNKFTKILTELKGKTIDILFEQHTYNNCVIVGVNSCDNLLCIRFDWDENNKFVIDLDRVVGFKAHNAVVSNLSKLGISSQGSNNEQHEQQE